MASPCFFHTSKIWRFAGNCRVCFNTNADHWKDGQAGSKNSVNQTKNWIMDWESHYTWKWKRIIIVSYSTNVKQVLKKAYIICFDICSWSRQLTSPKQPLISAQMSIWCKHGHAWSYADWLLWQAEIISMLSLPSPVERYISTSS